MSRWGWIAMGLSLGLIMIVFLLRDVLPVALLWTILDQWIMR